ncbi:hypothetical protein FPV67DRAFT_1675335 [Lyophyllum atratum]|nr:hypothetical protein FPV67DRAFT_1675335 [Lyophyllum atratum]
MALSPLNLDHLVLEILSHANIVDASSYSWTNQTNRNIVSSHMRKVVRRAVGSFFGNSSLYEEFWDVLTLTQGVLTGDISLAVMQPLSQAQIRLAALMIHVPRGGAATMAMFLVAVGYQERTTPGIHFGQSTMDSWKNMRAFRTSTHTIVCVEATGGSVLPVVLTGPSTAVMNAITATTVYMFYPTLTLSGHAVAGLHWPVPFVADLHARHGLLGHWDERYLLGVPCSYECRGLMRRVRGDGGMALVTWNRDREEDKRGSGVWHGATLFTSTSMDSVNTAFGMEDFLLELLKHVNLPDAVLISGLSWFCRCAAQRHMAAICKDSVRDYFPDEAVSSTFWTTLDGMQGIVSGSTCLAVFQAQATRRWSPNDLNIVIPCQRLEELARFFYACGATHRTAVVMSTCADTTRSYTVFCLPGNNRMIGVAESATASVLPVVLDGRSTALMNIMTGRSFTSFYPHLTGAGLAVVGFVHPTSLERSRHSVKGVTLLEPSELWRLRGRCGWECGAIQRRIRGGRGIGTLVWNASASGGFRQEDAPIVWGLLGVCKNPRCEFRERRRSNRLREYWN